MNSIIYYILLFSTLGLLATCLIILGKILIDALTFQKKYDRQRVERIKRTMSVLDPVIDYSGQEEDRWEYFRYDNKTPTKK
jgi:hypothetical protein